MNVTRTISVTAEDITRGIRRKCQICPAARAISKHLREQLRIYVWGDGNLSIGYPIQEGRMNDFELPKCVGDFVRDFDNDRDVQPFTFPLTLPAEYWREQSTADQIVDASEANKVTVGGNNQSPSHGPAEHSNGTDAVRDTLTQERKA
jgi:hypothetical protein